MTCFRIAQTDRLEGTEANGILSPCRHDLNRHTALINIFTLIKGMKLGAFGVYERFAEGFVLLFIHRAVDIVVLSAAVIA